MAAPGQRILPKAKALRLSSEFQAVSSLSMAEEEQLTLIPDTRSPEEKQSCPTRDTEWLQKGIADPEVQNRFV